MTENDNVFLIATNPHPHKQNKRKMCVDLRIKIFSRDSLIELLFFVFFQNKYLVVHMCTLINSLMSPKKN